MKNESVTIQHIVKLYVYFFRYLDRRAFHAKLWYAYISVWLASISSLLFIWVVLYQKFECDLHLLHLKKKRKNEGLIDWFQKLNKQRVSNRFYRWNMNHYWDMLISDLGIEKQFEYQHYSYISTSIDYLWLQKHC